MAIPDRDRLGGTAFARAWARLGFPVFPLSTLVKDGKWTKAPALKVPETDDDRAPDTIPGLDRSKGGFHQASTDDGYVHKTWANLRGRALVGSPLPTDVICLDFDKSESAWLEAHPELVEIYQKQRAATFVVQTQDAERFHVYFRVPMGTRVPARFPGHGPAPPDNIRHFGELKGCWSSEGNKAGYVALPTQQRPDGKGSYHVVTGTPTDLVLMDPRLLGHLLDGAVAAPSQAPTGPSVSLRPSTYTRAGEDWRMSVDVGEGEREPALHALAWSRDWRSAEELRVNLSGYNDLHCKPPHPQSYIDEIAAREWEKYRTRGPRQPAEETVSAPQTVVEPDPAPEPPPTEEPPAQEPPPDIDSTGKLIADASADGLRKILARLSINVRWNKRAARHEIQQRQRGWEGLTPRASEILAERAAESAVKEVHERFEPWRLSPQMWRQTLHRLTADSAVDPFSDWLDALPAWDGRTRLRDAIDRVMAPVDASDRLWHWACVAPFVAAVRRTQEPGLAYPHITFYCGVRPNAALRLWEALLPDHRDVGHVDLGGQAKDQARACVGPVIMSLSGFDARGAGRALRRLVTTREDAFWEGGARVECPRRCILIAAAAEDAAIPAECRSDDMAIAARVRPRTPEETAAGVQWIAAHRPQLWAEAVALAAQWVSLEPPSDVVAEAKEAVSGLAYREDNSEELAREWARTHRTGRHLLHQIAKLADVPHDSERRLPKRVLDGVARGIKREGWRRVNRRDAHGVQRLVWVGRDGEEAPGVLLTGGAGSTARRSARMTTRSASTAPRVVDIGTGRSRG